MKRIAILGAGYGGIAAARTLHKLFKRNGEVEITLYDRNPFHTLMTELHEVAGGRCEPESVQVSLHKIFAGTNVAVVVDDIRDISFTGNVLRGAEASYPYDYLVLGPGAEPEYFGIPGAKENAFPLWSYNHALRLRRHIEDQFLKASREPHTLKRRKALTFAVAGAGFTGIEMLGELLEWKRPLCERYGIDENDVTIMLVEAMTEVLPTLPRRLRQATLRFLARNRAVVALNTPIIEVRPDAVVFKGGEVVETETLIWTCGVRGADLTGRLDFTGGKDFGTAGTEEESNLKFNITKKGRLRSNDFMQSVDFDNVFLTGDVVWYSEKNRTLPQVVETALQTGECAAKNIHASIKGKPLKAFHANYHGFLVSVGSRFAVAHVMGMVLRGFMAMAMKHVVNLHYLWEIAGVNQCWEYLQHHFFTIRDNRSQVGGQLARKTPSYWLLPVRVALGAMWTVEVLEKVFKGWLDPSKGPVSSWMFSPGVIQAGWTPNPDAVTAATGEGGDVVEVVAEGTKQTIDLLAAMSNPILPKDFFVVKWMQAFMDGIMANIHYVLLQYAVVGMETAIALALLGGTFTWVAGAASLVLCLNFTLSGYFSWNSAWMIFASVAMLGGAGRVLGLDAWIMPWLHRWWNRTKFAQKTFLYTGEPRRRG
jgi:NADH dehydrogenase